MHRAEPGPPAWVLPTIGGRTERPVRCRLISLYYNTVE
jgi:hypothetical protein